MGRGRLIYKPLLDAKYIDEEMDEKLKALSGADSTDTKKGGRLSSLQKKKTKPKSTTKTTK